MSQELAELRKRVNRLERRWTLGWVVAVVAAATVSVASQVSRESMTAQEFVVVDPESGQRRAVLELDARGPSLRLFNERGGLEVHRGVTTDGPTLTFVNPNQQLNPRREREDLFNPRLFRPGG